MELLPGPGCPVCVVPAKEIDEAIFLAKQENVILATFGDMTRVPASYSSLWKARAEGANVKIVYSPIDAVQLAKKYKDKEVVFFSVGFETTAPGVASLILNDPPENFSILCSHRLIPPIMELLLGIGDLHIDGFICPGHVATIIGVKPFEIFADAYNMPTVIAGFEPADILIAVLMILKQIVTNDIKCENEYLRCVKYEGNVKAQETMNEVFVPVSAHWRGIGRVPKSGFSLRKPYENFDARKKFDIRLEHQSRDILPGCSCHLVLIGKIYPPQCKLFGKVCTPASPYGPCMVSQEGTCRIWFKFRRQMNQ